MTKTTRRLDYLPFGSKKWHTETITGTRTEIENRAKMVAWVQSCAVNVSHTDENGHGFPDETYGNWGSIRCTSEAQYLKAFAA